MEIEVTKWTHIEDIIVNSTNLESNPSSLTTFIDSEANSIAANTTDTRKTIQSIRKYLFLDKSKFSHSKPTHERRYLLLHIN